MVLATTAVGFGVALLASTGQGEQFLRRLLGRGGRATMPTITDDMTKMPGESYRGPLPPLTALQVTLERQLRADVERLAGKIGPRGLYNETAYNAAAEYLEKQLADAGYKPVRQLFSARGRSCFNIEATLPGATKPEEIILLGAHYDTVSGSPGADDNGSGLASLLSLARLLKAAAPERTIRFVAFANEEGPYFGTREMGSEVYAAHCRARGDKIVAMLSLETMGYYTNAAGSQRYPAPLDRLYPSTGNFVALVSDPKSASLVRQAVKAFREHERFPCEGVALPSYLPGVGWSDHASFWKHGYPAILVTDTAMYRNPHYHQASDRPDTLNYDALARVVTGLNAVIEKLDRP